MTKEEDFAKASAQFDGIYAQVAFSTGCEHGYHHAVEKACRFIRLHIGVDIPVRLTPDGEPLAEDFINKAEARVNATNKVVEQFKQFMEE